MDSKSITKIFLIGVAVVLTLFGIAFCFSSAIRVDQGEIVVVQQFSGSMDVFTDPGWHICPFSHSTTYRKSSQYVFQVKSDTDWGDAIPIRFVDGAKGCISGSIRANMPTDRNSMLAIQSDFGSQEAVDHQLVRTAINKAVNMTGPMMTSKESYAEKRADLISFVEDQAEVGIYAVTVTEVTTTDPLTKETKTLKVASVVKDATGKLQRVEDSPVVKYHVNLSNFALDGKGVYYDSVVEEQIKTQQEATMAVQTSTAKATQAQQEALTAAAQGQADATKAKWEQETANAKVVAEAEGRALAAEQDAKAAEFTKAAMISKGQGEAAYRTALTASNNNLDAKVAAWQAVNLAYAQAIEKTGSNLVPSTVLGSNGSGGGSSVNDLIDMMKVKTAQELNLDLTNIGKQASAPAAAH